VVEFGGGDEHAAAGAVERQVEGAEFDGFGLAEGSAALVDLVDVAAGEPGPLVVVEAVAAVGVPGVVDGELGQIDAVGGVEDGEQVTLLFVGFD
jgi:hypothetical protein